VKYEWCSLYYVNQMGELKKFFNVKSEILELINEKLPQSADRLGELCYRGRIAHPKATAVRSQIICYIMSGRLPTIGSQNTARSTLSVCPRYLSCRVPTQRWGEIFYDGQFNRHNITWFVALSIQSTRAARFLTPRCNRIHCLCSRF